MRFSEENHAHETYILVAVGSEEETEGSLNWSGFSGKTGSISKP